PSFAIECASVRYAVPLTLENTGEMIPNFRMASDGGIAAVGSVSKVEMDWDECHTGPHLRIPSVPRKVSCSALATAGCIGISNGILPYCSVAAAMRGQTRRRRVDNTEQVQQRGGAFVSSSSPAQAGGLMLAIGLGRWFARRVRLLVGPSQPSAHHVH